jgi:ribosomal protein L37E
MSLGNIPEEGKQEESELPESSCVSCGFLKCMKFPQANWGKTRNQDEQKSGALQ